MIGKPNDWNNILGKLVVQRFSADELVEFKNSLLNDPSAVYDAWKKKPSHEATTEENPQAGQTAEILANNIAQEMVMEQMEATKNKFISYKDEIQKELATKLIPIVGPDISYAGKKKQVSDRRMAPLVPHPLDPHPDLDINKDEAKNWDAKEWAKQMKDLKYRIDRLRPPYVENPTRDQMQQAIKLEETMKMLSKAGILAKLSREAKGRSDAYDPEQSKADIADYAGRPDSIFANDEESEDDEEADDGTREVTQQNIKKPGPNQKIPTASPAYQSQKNTDVTMASNPLDVLQEKEEAGQGIDSDKEAVGEEYAGLADEFMILMGKATRTPDEEAKLKALETEMATALARLIASNKFSFLRSATTVEELEQKDKEETERLKKHFEARKPYPEEDIPVAPVEDPEEAREYALQVEKNQQDLAAPSGQPPMSKYDLAKRKNQEVKSLPEPGLHPEEPERIEKPSTRATEAFYDLFYDEGVKPAQRGKERRPYDLLEPTQELGSRDNFKEKILFAAAKLAQEKVHHLGDVMRSQSIQEIIRQEVERIKKIDPEPKKLQEQIKEVRIWNAAFPDQKKPVPELWEADYAIQYVKTLTALLEKYALKILQNNAEFTGSEDGARDYEREALEPTHSIDKEFLMELVKDKAKMANKALRAWQEEYPEKLQRLVAIAQDMAKEEFAVKTYRDRKQMHEWEAKQAALPRIINNYAQHVMQTPIPVPSGFGSATLNSIYDQLDNLALEGVDAVSFEKEMTSYVENAVKETYEKAYSIVATAFGRVKPDSSETRGTTPALERPNLDKKETHEINKLLGNKSIATFLREHELSDDITRTINNEVSKAKKGNVQGKVDQNAIYQAVLEALKTANTGVPIMVANKVAKYISENYQDFREATEFKADTIPPGESGQEKMRQQLVALEGQKAEFEKKRDDLIAKRLQQQPELGPLEEKYNEIAANYLEQLHELLNAWIGDHKDQYDAMVKEYAAQFENKPEDNPGSVFAPSKMHAMDYATAKQEVNSKLLETIENTPQVKKIQDKIVPIAEKLQEQIEVIYNQTSDLTAPIDQYQQLIDDMASKITALNLDLEYGRVPKQQEKKKKGLPTKAQ